MSLIDKLTNFIRNGFVLINSLAADHLGNRSTYIGASEMSLTNCPQQIIKSKLLPVPPDYKSALRFSKGHAMEDVLENALKASVAEHLKGLDVDFIREIEYVHATRDAIKCHIDFQISTSELAKIIGKENMTPEIEACDVVFLETKSSKQAASISKDQLWSQIGIAHTTGIKAVNFCIILDTASGDIEVDGPYFHNETRWIDLEARGAYLLECLAGRLQPKAIPGISCSFCQYRENCTAFPCLELPAEITMKIIQANKLSEGMAKLEAQRKQATNELKAFFGKDTKCQVAGLILNMKSYPSSSSYDGAELAKVIGTVKTELEQVTSLLVGSAGDDLFAFAGAADIYNGLKKSISDLETSLETCRNSKSAFTKMEIKGDKKPLEKKTAEADQTVAAS